MQQRFSAKKLLPPLHKLRNFFMIEVSYFGKTSYKKSIVKSEKEKGKM